MTELQRIPSILPAVLIQPGTLSKPEVQRHTPSQASANEGVDSFNAIQAETLTQHDVEISRMRSVVIIGTVSSITLLNSLLTGVLTVALPRMASDLYLKESLLLWPASVYALTCGCTLLLSGSMADVVGSRTMYLSGCSLLLVFTLGCGLAKTGIQLIMFRAFQGIAISFCLPSSVSITTSSFPTGQRRNIAFACLGAAQPVGFSIGLVLGGVFVDSIGWRFGYYLGVTANAIILAVAVWGLPKDPRQVVSVTWKRIALDIDWIGAVIASTSLGAMSYVFAMVTASTSHLRDPPNIALLIFAVCLLPAFVFWVGRQERLGRPAIIPNSLWRNRVFTCICIVVFFTWAVFNAFQFFITLVFQEVQGLSAVQTSIRFLPMVVSGCGTNVGTGLLVPRVPANWLVLGSSTLTLFSPLLMAIAHKEWPYWYVMFPATMLSPVSADVLFTVSNLVITSVFPSQTHGLAGGVFNTLAQIGNSIGLAVMGIVASTVTAKSGYKDKKSPDALLVGYQATFWTCFGILVVMLGFSSWGLRRIGKVGLKTD
ncbi:MAG: hypothetical protein M1814_003001 [Vezdaea aestivalis]|nr:MAG: hypothetical protein M1814_003001 [Vezdaea aestivalis]